MVKDRTRQPAPNDKPKLTRWRSPTLGLLGLVAYLVYTAIVVDPRFIYNTAGLITNFPCFYYGWWPLLEHISRPGGTLEYISAFLAQGYYHRWLGAAIITSIACLSYLCSYYYLLVAGLTWIRSAAIVGPIVILALHNQYVYTLDMILACTIAVCICCYLMKLNNTNELWKTFLSLTLMPIIYWAIGAASLLAAALLSIGALARRKHGWPMVVVSVWAAICPYLLGALVYGDSPAVAYSWLAPWSQSARHLSGSALLLTWALYLGLPLVAAMAIAVGVLRGNQICRSLNWWLEASIVALVGLGVAWWSYDPRLRALFAVDYYGKVRDWQRVIDIARAVPYNYLICHIANKALFHTNRLGDSMSSLPQDPTSLMLTARPAFWHKAETCMELGLINEAEDALCMCIEIYGERPILLDRLATINIVKGKTNAAKVLLGTLARMPFWTGIARQRLYQLEMDPNLGTDPSIQYLRRLMLRRDWVRPRQPLPELLEENPTNRMAYEYRMAQLLLTKDLAGLVQTFNRYHHLNMGTIPRHYQEALLLAKALDLGVADLKGQQIDNDVLKSFFSFIRTMASYGSDLSKAASKMKDRFADTYFYYFYLGGQR